MTLQQDSTHPTGVVDTSPRGSSGATRARERKAHAALQLRREHHTWDEIAATLGYPTGRAALVATEQSLESLLTTESQEFMLQMAGDRLDTLLKGVWKKAENANDPEHLAAVDRARLLIAQHAEMFGYMRPKVTINTSPTAADIEKFVAKVLQSGAPPVEEADLFDIEEVPSERVDDAAPSQ